MRIEDLYRQLSYAELSNLAVAVDASGTIKEAKRPQVIQLANDGLKRLHTLLLIREGSTILERVPGQEDYPLVPSAPYLDPSFDDIVLKIHGAYDRYGCPILLNDAQHRWALSTTASNVLRIPENFYEDTLEVVYRAGHPSLDPNDLEQEIELPGGLEEALRAYIAAKMFGGIMTAEALQAAKNHMDHFNAICADAEGKNWLHQGKPGVDTKFINRGFI